ncbi:hypothetical protein DFJ77DRAFT_114600 [Powellomyces hirtus]|nr:hypothetical protein DFJ77DRAFT_114600 [Powellomyces hirtus]
MASPVQYGILRRPDEMEGGCHRSFPLGGDTLYPTRVLPPLRPAMVANTLQRPDVPPRTPGGRSTRNLGVGTEQQEVSNSTLVSSWYRFPWNSRYCWQWHERDTISPMRASFLLLKSVDFERMSPKRSTFIASTPELPELFSAWNAQKERAQDLGRSYLNPFIKVHAVPEFPRGGGHTVLMLPVFGVSCSGTAVPPAAPFVFLARHPWQGQFATPFQRTLRACCTIWRPSNNARSPHGLTSTTTIGRNDGTLKIICAHIIRHVGTTNAKVHVNTWVPLNEPLSHAVRGRTWRGMTRLCSRTGIRDIGRNHREFPCNYIFLLNKTTMPECAQSSYSIDISRCLRLELIVLSIICTT